VEVIEFVRKLIDKVLAGYCVLGVATVDGVSGKDRRIAQVFEPATAIEAISVDSSNPGDTDASSLRQLAGRALDDLSYDLMTGDQRLLAERQVSFGDVEIGSADAAGTNPEKNLARGELRGGDLFNSERLFCNVLRASEEGGLHLGPGKLRSGLALIGLETEIGVGSDGCGVLIPIPKLSHFTIRGCAVP
jgi:hypothetical protein